MSTCLARELKEKIQAVADRYGWSPNKAQEKIKATMLASAGIAPRNTMEQSANFLLGNVVNPIICDDCNVQGVFEHRCHGRDARVRGVRVGRHCQCPDCFVINILGFS